MDNFSEKLEVEGRSLWQDARRRFMHNRAALASLFVLTLITLFVVVGPMVAPFNYADTDWNMMSSAPDMVSKHYFGTDSSGRDLLVRVAIGGRISLMVGVAAALVCGVSTRSIVLRHVVPNVLGVVVVYASLLVPSMILFESFLSFLGLGTQEPLSSWGALLNDGANSMEVA
ncbi:ABC transporter permease subunit, partial [Dickeya dadantii]|uniref:ABC transporter permease subunit n=1 Tax=Dickeya dadantii TaxID=204038 RepID=UPI0020A6B605